MTLSQEAQCNMVKYVDRIRILNKAIPLHEPNTFARQLQCPATPASSCGSDYTLPNDVAPAPALGFITPFSNAAGENMADGHSMSGSNAWPSVLGVQD